MHKASVSTINPRRKKTTGQIRLTSKILAAQNSAQKSPPRSPAMDVPSSPSRQDQEIRRPPDCTCGFNFDIVGKKIAELEVIIKKLNNDKHLLTLVLNNLQKSNEEMLEQNNKYKSELFCEKNVLKSAELTRFYTGFQSLSRYITFRNFVKKGYEHNKGTSSGKGRPCKITFEDRLFMFLCRMRLGLLEEDLSYRFKISIGLVSEICSYFTVFLAKYLSQVPIWMSRERVNQTMPLEFKNVYPNTRIIIDTTHIYVEVSSDFNTQSETYSSYKAHNTGCAIVGIAPNGFITFIGDMVPGRMSDKDSTYYSGLYKLLEPGDVVLADRGFLIEDDLKEIGASLQIPSFLHGESQLPLQNERESKKLAHFRIHVERIIKEIKSYRIIKFVFPNSMFDKLNDVWFICCMLCNFANEPLLCRK